MNRIREGMRAAAASKTWRWPALLALSLWLGAGGLEPGLAAQITNEPQGFNGYTWGSRHEEYPSLRLLADPAEAGPLPGVEVYEKPGEVLMINGVTFSRV